MDVNKDTVISCCRTARDGASAAILSHAGCLAAPTVMGLVGGSISHNFMAATMYVTSPIIAAGATWGLDKMRGQTASPLKLAGSAAIALAVAGGIHHFIGHDHGDEHNHHGYHQHTENSEPFWFNQDICGPSGDL